MIRLFTGGLPTLLLYIVLIGWGFLAWSIVGDAPPGRMTKGVVVTATTAPAVLGWKELGQRAGPRSAAAQHLQVLYKDGGWRFGNSSPGKRVLLSTDKYKARFIRRWEIRKGDRISLPNVDLLVTDLRADRLVLRERRSGREVVWDGELVPKGAPVTKVCENILRRNLEAAKWLSRTWFGDDKPEIRLFGIGGGVNCSNRWKMTALSPRAIYIVWKAGAFWVAPGAQGAETLFYRAGSQRGTSFADMTAPLSGPMGRVRSLIVGQTRYLVRAGKAQLSLRPVANQDFFFFDELPPVNARYTRWIGAGNGATAWLVTRAAPLAIGLFIGTALALFLLWYGRKHHRHNSWWTIHALAACVPSAIGIWVTLLAAQGGGNPDKALVVALSWVGWFWASFMLVWSGRISGYGGYIWVCATLLAGIGSVTLFQLGAGADNTRWIGFYYKHVALLGLFAWVVAIATAVNISFWRRLWLMIFNREGVVAAAAIVLILAMGLQFMLGSEEGIAGIQPVELVKTVFVVLLGYVGLHITETRRREVKAFRQSPIKFLAPYFRLAGIFFLFIASIVVGVRDFSPMVIMSVILMAWLWRLGGSQGEYSRAGKLFLLLRPAILLFIAGLLGVMYLIYQNPEGLPDGFPQKDRIMVWAEPAKHPHSGSQVLGSMDMVGQGSWLGAKGWFGRNGPIMSLPAVQDDFITAFLINRFGGIAGLLMLFVQLLFISLLFMLSRRIQAQYQRGDFREQNAGLVLGFTLYGLAWMHAAHWLISWGNTLGLLPVMGQPMTWLTAGNSHLIGFALLILTVALISAWISQSYTEEDQPR